MVNSILILLRYIVSKNEAIYIVIMHYRFTVSLE